MRDAERSASLQGHAYAALYYTVQRLRGSVTPQQVRDAADLLDGPLDTLLGHVRDRLGRMYAAGGDPFAWLERQPLIDREALRPVATAAYASRRRRVEHRKTSGSTGVPFVLVKDMAMSAQMDAAMWAVYGWYGINPGARQARFWGMPPAGVPRLRRTLSDLLANRQRFDAFRLSPGKAIRFYERLRRFRPIYAYGYPSLIRHFTAECSAQGLDGRDLGLALVITTGELMTEDQRRVLESYFGCRVVNEYGCTESGVLAFECEYRSMHAIPTAAYLEVVRQGGQGAAVDEPGEVVVTDLYGQALPLLRYRLHDRGVRLAGTCSCGRSLPLLRVDSGRLDDFILTPQRGPVYDAILAYTVPSVVRRFRARQVAPDHLVVDLIAGEGFEQERTPAICRNRLEQTLGPGMTISVRVVDDIPHEPSGKHRYFIPLRDAADGRGGPVSVRHTPPTPAVPTD